MTMFVSTLSSSWLLVPLLCAVIYYDLRYLRLPNVLSGLFVAVFVLGLLVAGPAEGLWAQIGVAFVVFCIGLALNAAGWLGGGDVKVLSALLLNVPAPDLLLFFFALFAAQIVGIAGLVLARRMRAGPTGWASLNHHGRYPVGLSIGLAGLAWIALTAFP